jgi:hypothetical protein
MVREFFYTVPGSFCKVLADPLYSFSGSLLAFTMALVLLNWTLLSKDLRDILKDERTLRNHEDVHFECGRDEKSGRSAIKDGKYLTNRKIRLAKRGYRAVAPLVKEQ